MAHQKSFVRNMEWVNIPAHPVIAATISTGLLRPDLSHVPALSGEMMEILYARKLGFPIRFEFRAYLTSNEWDQVLRSRDLPLSLC